MQTRKFPTFIKVPCSCTDEENFHHGRMKNCLRCGNTREMTSTVEAEEKWFLQEKEHKNNVARLRNLQHDWLYSK